MTYDDWQSFLVSDLGRELMKEFQVRINAERDELAQSLIIPVNHERMEYINKVIETRNFYEQLVYEFNHGLLGFVDDEEADNV